jgi:hypothetical protein
MCPPPWQGLLSRAILIVVFLKIAVLQGIWPTMPEFCLARIPEAVITLI